MEINRENYLVDDVFRRLLREFCEFWQRKAVVQPGRFALTACTLPRQKDKIREPERGWLCDRPPQSFHLSLIMLTMMDWKGQSEWNTSGAVMYRRWELSDSTRVHKIRLQRSPDTVSGYGALITNSTGRGEEERKGRWDIPPPPPFENSWGSVPGDRVKFA